MTSRQSARKGSTKRSASPAAVPMMMEAAPTPKATKTEKKPKSSSKNKVEPKPAAVKASKKKIVKEPAMVEDEEITSEESSEFVVVLHDDDQKETVQLVQDVMLDSTALHNVLRVQYVQMYAIGFALLASAFSSNVTVFPLFANATSLHRAVVGCLYLAQAFSLTAVAQSSFSAMKKTLQYNMFFHLLFALVVIVKEDPSHDIGVPILTFVSTLNVGLNLWACYFRAN